MKENLFKSWKRNKSEWVKVDYAHRMLFRNKYVKVLRTLTYAEIDLNKVYLVEDAYVSLDNFDVKFVEIVTDAGERVALSPEDVEIVSTAGRND